MANQTIPGNSDLTAQFTEIEIVRTGSKDGKTSYKIVARGEALGARWLQTSPSRKTGTFSFDSITGKSAWKDLFANDNPNSFLTSEGRSISFDTGHFRKTRKGDYVSRISLNDLNKDDITGLWKNASLFIDSTANDDANNVAGAITGFGLMPMVCGGSSITPVVITNYTNVQQTGSITVNPGLANEVGVFATAAEAQESPYSNCTARNAGGGNGIAVQENFTLQPGQTAVYYLGMGGQDYNLIGTSNNIAIGGLPGGTANQSWYDFWLSLTADEGYDKLTLNYSGTGGPGANNGQNGFNVTMATQTNNPDGSTTFQNSQTIFSPYSSSNTNGNWNGTGQPVIYWANQPIGLAWID